MLTNDEVVAIARIEVDQAQGYDADVLATVRENALNYYHGDTAAAPAGRSQFVSHDVADTVHALLVSSIQAIPDHPLSSLPQRVKRMSHRHSSNQTLYATS